MAKAQVPRSIKATLPATAAALTNGVSQPSLAEAAATPSSTVTTERAGKLPAVASGPKLAKPTSNLPAAPAGALTCSSVRGSRINAASRLTRVPAHTVRPGVRMASARSALVMVGSSKRLFCTLSKACAV